MTCQRVEISLPVTPSFMQDGLGVLPENETHFPMLEGSIAWHPRSTFFFLFGGSQRYQRGNIITCVKWLGAGGPSFTFANGDLELSIPSRFSSFFKIFTPPPILDLVLFFPTWLDNLLTLEFAPWLVCVSRSEVEKQMGLDYPDILLPNLSRPIRYYYSVMSPWKPRR